MKRIFQAGSLIFLGLLAVYIGFAIYFSYLSDRALFVEFRHTDADVYLETIDQVPTVNVSYQGKSYDIKAYGLDSAREISRSPDWNGKLIVEVRGLKATSHKKFFSPWLRVVNVSYGTEELLNPPWVEVGAIVDAAWDDRTANSIAHRQEMARVKIAPPGSWGSDGTLRTQYTELSYSVVNEVMNEIKNELGAKRLIVSGVSSSGNVTSGLLLLRSDLECVILASAPLDIEIFLQGNPKLSDLLGAGQLLGGSEIYDPSADMSEIKVDNDRMIYVGYSASDTVVPPQSPKSYAAQLKALGHKVMLEEALPNSLNSHDLALWKMEKENACAGIR